MTIDEIREIVISPDAIMKKEYGKVLLDEIDRLTAEGEKAKEVIDEINKLGVIATLGNPRKYAKRVDEVIKYYRNGKA